MLICEAATRIGEYDEISCYNRCAERWDLVEKLLVAQLALNFFALFWVSRFTTVFTWTIHWTISRAR